MRKINQTYLATVQLCNKHQDTQKVQAKEVVLTETAIELEGAFVGVLYVYCTGDRMTALV